MNFEKTIFPGPVDFSSASIFGEMKFDKAEFKSGLLFGDIEFFYMNPLKISRERVSFRRVSFEEPQKIVFDNLDMSYVSFIHTDVSRVQFRNVVWREDIGGYMPYDAILLFLAKSRKYRKRYFKNARKFLLETKEKLSEGIEKIRSF